VFIERCKRRGGQGVPQGAGTALLVRGRCRSPSMAHRPRAMSGIRPQPLRAH